MGWGKVEVVSAAAPLNWPHYFLPFLLSAPSEKRDWEQPIGKGQSGGSSDLNVTGEGLYKFWISVAAVFFTLVLVYSFKTAGNW